ncbi:hypothetical protein MA16_Dca027220 [Dendrobium catenatum]|uniref:Uncharacterized protein n=1 Tax=Dendrobium catenatum TaxID=906689 RepID=A0A2I0WHU8_9ASPA|nr:hypothetical protein MA16_Dca027220 [Dendrobium catenatum]
MKKGLVKIGKHALQINPNVKRLKDDVKKLDKISTNVGNFLHLLEVQNSTYGDIVLDAVKKEFKDLVGEMENLRNASKAKHDNSFDGDWMYPGFEEKQEDLPGEVSSVTMTETEVALEKET